MTATRKGQGSGETPTVHARRRIASIAAIGVLTVAATMSGAATAGAATRPVTATGYGSTSYGAESAAARALDAACAGGQLSFVGYSTYAQPSGSNPATSYVSRASGTCTTPTPPPPPPPTPTTFSINLQTVNGVNFLRAPSPPNGVVADATAPNPTGGGGRLLTLTDWNGGRLADGDQVSIRNREGRWLGALGGGGGYVSTQSTAPGVYERFTIELVSNGDFVDSGDRVALKVASGQFIMAVGGGGGQVKATGPRIGPWETFTFVRV